MAKILFLLVILLICPVIAAAQQQSSIVGTWKLISYEDIPENGRPVYPWGKLPLGILIYDDTGRMAVQIQRTPVRKALSKPESDLTLTDKASLLESFTAYFGTYSVDWKLMTITHHVEGNLFPVYVGTDQKKGFELTGNQLQLKAAWTSDGKKWKGTRIFEKILPKQFN